MEKGLGRLHIPDDRDEKFPMETVLPKSTPGIDYKYWWPSGWWGDQGNTPQCVAYAWLHWLEDGSVTQDHKEPPVLRPDWLYEEAQKIDYWPGENYDGTSVRAGAKMLQSLGYIKEYRWGWSSDDFIKALLTTGPVVVGTDWYSGMDSPTKEGVIKASGYGRGGHAYVLNGINLKTGLVRIKNSWGRSWGKNGYVYISIEDMERLIKDNGEVCLATEIKK